MQGKTCCHAGSGVEMSMNLVVPVSSGKYSGCMCRHFSFLHLWLELRVQVHARMRPRSTRARKQACLPSPHGRHVCRWASKKYADWSLQGSRRVELPVASAMLVRAAAPCRGHCRAFLGSRRGRASRRGGPWVLCCPLSRRRSASDRRGV